jgi:hypothetical protein
MFLKQGSGVLEKGGLAYNVNSLFLKFNQLIQILLVCIGPDNVTIREV